MHRSRYSGRGNGTTGEKHFWWRRRLSFTEFLLPSFDFPSPQLSAPVLHGRKKGTCSQGRSQYEANRGTCLSHCFFFLGGGGGSTSFFEGERKALAANKFTNS